MSLNTMYRTVSVALWRGTDRIARATEHRPHLRLAGMWWWHYGMSRGSFAAGATAAILIAGASPARFVETVGAAMTMWAIGLVAEAIHVIAFYDGQHDADGCPFCATSADGGDDGPGEDEPQPEPDSPTGRSALPERCPDFFADFEAQVSTTPAIREREVRS